MESAAHQLKVMSTTGYFEIINMTLQQPFSLVDPSAGPVCLLRGMRPAMRDDMTAYDPLLCLLYMKAADLPVHVEYFCTSGPI